METALNSIEIHKFGGTSLASAQHFRQIPHLLNHSEHTHAIVVSATANTTNTLQSLLDHACRQQPTAAQLNALKQAHNHLIEELITHTRDKQVLAHKIAEDIQALQILLHTTQLLGHYSKHIQDKVLGYGELWSAQILAAFFNQSAPTLFIDASQVLRTYQKNNQRHIQWTQSQERLQQLLIAHSAAQCFIITGFIAADDATNQQVTLGRNGSDYSAAVFARLFNANKLVIWTDVDGIYSADPNRVHSAFPLTALSYEEALELAYFGAKVLHPHTIFPAIHNNIPIFIKNSAKPEASGTLIHVHNHPSEYLIQGLSCIDDIALVNLEGSGMTGVSGIAARVFQVLYQHDISVILISQASSEHSICLAVKQNYACTVQQVLYEEFQFEIEQGLIKRIRIDADCAILAAVGDGMVGRQGISGRLCNTLARARINIKAIAQGSSERNLSVVVQRQDINRALRAVHAGFYLSRKTSSIGIIGPGQVGCTLLKQIAATFTELQQKHHVNLRIRGIINSGKMLLQHNINLDQWSSAFAESTCEANINDFIEHIAADDMPHAVIIDCTASQDIAEQYPQFLHRGLHIVTPNKRANSNHFDFYRKLQLLAKQMQRFYLYETTVCAGLPVIKTLQDIIATGDRVIQIQGVVSGTLSYIFNQLKTGQSFSSIVTAAKVAGYTEPDPRDDLSGTDVARKFVCLARELGHAAELADIKVHNLVPEPLRDVSIETFMQRLPDYDAMLHAQLQPLFDKQLQPCYVGCIDAAGHIQVNIAGFSQDHPFSRLTGTDNMVIFTTERYKQQPLIIQGPGAGTEVTAAGIFSDLLRLVTALD